MSETFEEQGTCLCGSVKINLRTLNTQVGTCHCSMCRKWGSGPFMAIDCGTDVSFEDNENISIYDSSEWAERAFCNKCGSHLFYRLKENKQFFMSVGLFKNEERFHLKHQVFIDNKPSFYSFSNQTDNMTEAELFAKYTS